MSSVYFGNAQKQTWIKAPLSGMTASSGGWITTETLLNGRPFVKRSDASHRKFDMSWLGSMNDESLDVSLHTIKDYYDGLYGEGPFFWNDPYAMKSNMFSPAWAAPAISIDSDWSAICPDGVGVTKSKVTTASISGLVGSNTAGYPTYTAKYEAPGSPTLEGDKFTFYIPQDYTLWVGLHGHHGESGAAFVRPYTRAGAAATPVQLTALGVNTTTRVNASFAGSSYGKAEFYLAKVSSGECTFHVSALIAQLLPSGFTPEVGSFISGRGTTGLEFASQVDIEYYSANINNGQIGLSASFVEV